MYPNTCNLTGAEGENPEDCTTHSHENDGGVHAFTVTVTDCTLEQARRVMTERIGYDEDYGFDYRIDWTDQVLNVAT